MSITAQHFNTFADPTATLAADLASSAIRQALQARRRADEAVLRYLATATLVAYPGAVAFVTVDSAEDGETLQVLDSVRMPDGSTRPAVVISTEDFTEYVSEIDPEGYAGSLHQDGHWQTLGRPAGPFAGWVFKINDVMGV